MDKKEAILIILKDRNNGITICVKKLADRPDFWKMNMCQNSFVAPNPQ